MPTYNSISVISEAQSRFALTMTKLRVNNLQDSYLTALSGGADSSALALLTQHYANVVGKEHHAIIVDHGLRDQSYTEACRVKDQMRIHGVNCDIVSIDGPRPSSGIQEWARLRRYQILISVARDRGATILFAHHSNDQAETIAMRLLRGSGLVGLAGMSSSRIQHGINIIRPLLQWSRSQLLDVCCHFGYVFEDDPSNSDRQFERVRIRHLLAQLALRGEGPSSDQLSRLGVISAKLLTAATNANASTLAKVVEWHDAGYATLATEHLADLPKFRFALLMRRLLMSISSSHYAPSGAAFDELRKRIGVGLSATLGGCHFSPVLTQIGRTSNEKGKSLTYRVFRETGRDLITVAIAAGDEVEFAGSWLVRSQQAGILHALGDTNKFRNSFDNVMADKNIPEEWHSVPHRARRAIPVLTTLDGGLIYPQIGYYGKYRSVAPLSARFLGMAKDPTYHVHASKGASW